jgi:hypothetical protein
MNPIDMGILGGASVRVVEHRGIVRFSGNPAVRGGANDAEKGDRR